VIICVNLLDEAKKRGTNIDLGKLSQLLGVPAVGTVAKRKKSAKKLIEAMERFADDREWSALKPVYPVQTELCISELEIKLNLSRFICVQYLTGNMTPDIDDAEVVEKVCAKWYKTARSGGTARDVVEKTIISTAERISGSVVSGEKNGYSDKDRRLDQLLTSKHTGYPVMLALLAIVLWITIVGANYPSQLLSNLLFKLEDGLTALFKYFNAPDWLHGALILGVYRVLSWVVSVMLPPMAIFFPLFTLLEDAGYLPRIAYNLDKPFQKCNACGKQALTMW
ncbi:MAG: ferrous iron transporter B, partial [Oscillospiraceae bacterium]|nr:ferrous iron transporter B [Oscillospiraceae bacterium]